VLASGSHCKATDCDHESVTTNGLPREGKNLLDERNAARKKSTVRKKRCDGFGRNSDDEVANGECVGTMGTARDHDRRGRPLPDWQGCRAIENDTVFLMNRDEPASLDGRYFGAVPVSSIVGRATPFLTANEP